MNKKSKTDITISSKMLDDIDFLLETQGSNGNWNHDPYMHGMYNGMELIVSMIKGKSPEYKGPPDKWGCENICDDNGDKNIKTPTLLSEKKSKFC